MRRTLMVLAALAASPSLVGCATSANLFGKDPCKVYGGTRLDTTLISEGFSPDPVVAKEQRLESPVLAYEGYCGLFDLPLSVIADTATLPITVPIAMARLGTDPQPVPSTQKTDDSTPDPGNAER